MSIKAQKSLLGSLIIDYNAHFLQVSRIAFPIMFSKNEQKLADYLWKLSPSEADDLDPVVIASETNLDVVYVQTIAAQANTAQVEKYAEIIRDAYISRRTLEIRDKTTKKIREGENIDLAFAFEKNELKTLEAYKGVDDGYRDQQFQDALDSLEDAKGKNGILGFSTGWGEVDRITGGFQPAKFNVLAARPGMGKTQLVCHMIKNQLDFGVPVGLNSLEMSSNEILRRLGAMYCGVNPRKIRQGATSKEIDQLKRAIEHIHGLPLYMDTVVKVEDIERIGRRWKSKYDIRILFIDYLQLVKSSLKTESQEASVADVSRRFKLLGMKNDCDMNVTALSQLSRALETRTDKRPRLSDLRYSGAIEQDVDNAWFLYRPDVYDKNNGRKIVEFIQAKDREGGMLETLEFHFDPTYGLYSEITDDNGIW